MTDFIEKYKEISGRDVESEEAAIEHFKNLSALAFAKKEKDEDANKKIEDAKKELEPFKAFVESIGVDLTSENTSKVAESIKEYLGEQHGDIKPRAASTDPNADKKALEESVRRGDASARTKLIQLHGLGDQK